MNQLVRMIGGWFRPKFRPEENAIDEYERLWKNQESGRSITFLSIAFGTSSTDAIVDLGLSHWSKRGFQQQIAYHWRIGEKVETSDVVEFGNPDSFDFGTTQTITTHDIGIVLDDWVFSLSKNCEELCIVMYGAQSIMTLGRYWRAPIPVVVLDLEAAWHQQHHQQCHSTFEEVASASKDITNATSTLDHAGNQAYCLLLLLKSLEEKNENPSQKLEDSFE